jgi:hypothetical protein
MAGPASVNDARQTGKTSAFRSSMTSSEGHIAGKIVDGKVIGLNLVDWTVDVSTTFDRKKYLNIQVASSYMHYSNGEGIYAMPEIGAKCTVCLPSDSSPPFVLCFIMPVEKVADASTPDAPKGTTSHGGVMNNATAARFDGGRPRAKPGDIMLRGRDGQFVILHRGGVLQIGANELSQRIFIPLDNHMLDISERYSHHNVGGSILWGLSAGLQDTAVTNVEVFRVFADDKYADIRISKGHVANPIDPESGLPARVVYEVVVSPKGFNADSGDAASSDTAGAVVYKFALDREGNISTAIKGDVFCHIKKKLTLKVDSDLVVETDTHMAITAKSGMDISGGVYTHVKGDLVRLGKGDIAVAFKGGIVSTPINLAPFAASGTLILAGTMILTMPGLPPGTPIPFTIAGAAFTMPAGVITTALPQVGAIMNGNETVKV